MLKIIVEIERVIDLDGVGTLHDKVTYKLQLLGFTIKNKVLGEYESFEAAKDKVLDVYSWGLD